ncbi:MAG: hypothetical protein AB1894_15430 [Chloroflexota bacterium]
MHTRNPTLKPGLFILASFLAFLTACSSNYLDALYPAIDHFNLSANAVNLQIDLLIADSAVFMDASWQSQTRDITLMDKGSQYLNRVNELLPQISAEVERLNQ